MAAQQLRISIGSQDSPLRPRSFSDPSCAGAVNQLDFGMMLRNRGAKSLTRPPVSNMSALHGALTDQLCHDSSDSGPADLASSTAEPAGNEERMPMVKKIIFLLLGIALMIAFALPSKPIPGFEGKDLIPGSYDHKKRDHIPAQRCLGLLLLVSVYWATEPISPHITALLIPMLVVILGVQRVPDFDDDGLVPGSHCPHHEASVPGDPGDRLTAAEAAAVTSAAFFDPVILLFLGGFTMAAALDKYGVSERIALHLLTNAGSRPSRVLLTIMVLCVFLSMWVSNVAAAVLNSAIMLPLLRSLPPTSGWPKMVLLGIAYACNVGGMATPIASPQNVIALTALKSVAPDYPVSFLGWILFAVPICICATLVCWLWLRWYFKTGLPEGIQTNMIISNEAPGPSSILAESPTADKRMGLKEWYIVGVVTLTVFMWCIFDTLEPVFGNMGIVALFPVIALYGPQLLTPTEFNSTPWSVLILMGGGLALGNAVKSSGLLKVIADRLGHMLAGQSLFVVSFAFNAFAGILANFISSTVSAIIMLPIIAQVGLGMGHPRALVVGATIMCSGAMGLPVSSFPNANAMAARRSTEGNEPFLLTGDFSRTGFPMAFFMLVLMQSLGFALCLAYGW